VREEKYVSRLEHEKPEIVKFPGLKLFFATCWFFGVRSTRFLP